MPSPTPSNRIELQAFNSNNDTWGVDHLNPAFDVVDQALDGTLFINTDIDSSPIALAVVDYVPSDFRNRVINVQGFSASVFVINLPTTINKWYVIVNQSSTELDINGAYSITETGIYHALVYDGSVVSLNKVGSPVRNVVVDNISTGATVNISPDMCGTVYVLDRDVVDTINILDVSAPEEDNPAYKGYNVISFPVGLGVSKAEVNGVYYPDMTEVAPIYLGSLSPVSPVFAYLTVSRIPGTNKVMITDTGGVIVDN